MLVFAFCLVGVIVVLIKMGIGGAVDSIDKAATKKNIEDTEAFIKSITASKDEIEKAYDSTDYGDILDDLRYITNNKKSDISLIHICKTKQPCCQKALRWDKMAASIRLSKKGLTDGDYTNTRSVSVWDDTEDACILRRYFEVLSINYTNAGIGMYVKERLSEMYGGKMLTLGLSRFW